MLWPTTEIRWFYRLSSPPGIPEPVWRWFQDLPGSFLAEPERTDHYLLLEDAAGLGVKVRQGRLEVKYRLARPLPTALNPRAAGQIEEWGKWSLAVVGEDVVIPEPGFPWQAVSKTRWLRGYQPDRPESVAPPPLREGQLGCDLELVQVTVGASLWWSLALEAYGQDQTSRQNFLRRVAGHILTAGQAPDLEPLASMGYPSWLELI